MNKPRTLENHYILDLESKPQEDLLEAFFATKRTKNEEVLIELAKSIVGKRADAQEKYVKDLEKAMGYAKEETQERHKEIAEETLVAKNKELDTAVTDKEKEMEAELTMENYHKELSVSTLYSRVVCVGFKKHGFDSKGEANPVVILSLEEFASFLNDKFAAESQRRKDARAKSTVEGDLVGSGSYFTLITFNGKNFDLRVLINCLIKKNLVSQNIINQLRNATKRYRGLHDIIGHVDLQEDAINSNGKSMSLDAMLRVFCGTKKETLGDAFFKNATEEDLKQHCLEDISFTEDLFNKFHNN